MVKVFDQICNHLRKLANRRCSTLSGVHDEWKELEVAVVIALVASHVPVSSVEVFHQPNAHIVIERSEYE